MERPTKPVDYKSLSDEELRKLCVQHGLYSNKRRMLAAQTYINALKARDRKLFGIRPPKHNYALDYKCYAPADLRSFCVQRGIYDQSRRDMVKSTYVSALRTQDRQATFRFFDLPPELRVVVYSMLLNHQRGDKVGRTKTLASIAYPQILRASKLCYREARGVLYQQSSLTMKVSTWDERLRVRGDIAFGVEKGKETVDLFGRLLPKFAGIWHANVVLVEDDYGDFDDWSLEWTLQALVKAFRRKNALKTLTIKFVCTCGSRRRHERRKKGEAKTTPQEIEELETELRTSLRRLPATTQVQLTGLEKISSQTMRFMLARADYVQETRLKSTPVHT
ncbi:unnamed protein product [Zymoseptoria tritici ST99CH_1A5]|uniref:Uncharacterized protein n=3 Tax=Zymoseptoria tritici TaxID=1047171 RepID=A0A1X7RVM2_ZYMT9|nr:unnamed protein product [Zymoseptoria tritici ST99CH_3D7]SMR53562.1 unnamed protein product [Zymoseptoria tritici ST99CH_1E4]SMR55939.1 unnamed protein product [Zymoseptoria tritici ST99CH_3D1]SMY25128.1 unnamed protein product [Zymoseptoria tritici ST99CH_1A5]